MAIKKFSDLQQKFAIKTMPKERIKNNVEMLRNELAVLQLVDHPNIIKSHDVYEDPKSLHIVMEFSSGGELYSRLSRKKFFKEPEAADIMYKMFHSISHMHTLGVCHRDLKPENCLYDSARDDADIKLIDFGLSKRFEPGDEMESFVGSSLYLAPEVFKKRYGPECDLWSLGVIMYTLLVGYNPFQGKDTADLYKKIMKAGYSFNGEEWKRVSKEAKDLIRLLLNPDPKKRPTAAQAMDHVWFTNVRPERGVEADREILEKLTKFKYQNVLKADALRVLYLFLTSKELLKANECFRRMDAAHIGFINESELNEALQRAGLSAEHTASNL
jgi:calcium-dependent protein kinase